MRCESALLSLMTTATFSGDCPWTTGAALRQMVRQLAAPTRARRMPMTSASGTVAKLRLKPPSNGSTGQNSEPSLLGGRSAAALRQLLKAKTCHIRPDAGFRRCLAGAPALCSCWDIRELYGGFAASRPPFEYHSRGRTIGTHQPEERFVFSR